MDIIADITNIYQAYITKQMSENEAEGELDTIAIFIGINHLLATDDLVEVISLLTEYALRTEYAPLAVKSSVRESLLHAVFEAILYNQVSEFVNWDNLVAHLDQLWIDDLLSALYFLAFSKNESYIPFLETYTHHQSKVVREYTLGAIEGIRKKNEGIKHLRWRPRH